MVPVGGAEAIATSLSLAQNEGIFTGISGGASMAAALKVCEQAPEGSTVLTMLADTAERYLSTPLFAGIDADMNEQELATSESTPNFQLPPPQQ
jgi:cysteine synthase A